MKIAITALVAVVALGTSSIACSSSASKDEVDTGSALSELRNPTGSFSDQTAGSAFGNYRSKKADSSKVSAPSASTGGSSTQSIRLLDKATSSAACQQGASCACPGGGSMSYTGGTSADGTVVKVSFDSCTFEDGFGFDGQAVLLVSNKSLLGLAAAAPAKATPAPAAPSDPSGDRGLQDAEDTSDAPTTAGGAQGQSILLAAKGSAFEGTKKLPFEFALVSEAQYTFLAVKVSDGSIVIGLNESSGDAIVKSKEGTWKCHSTSGEWSCTSASGKTMNVKEAAPTEASVSGESSAPSGGDSPAPAPSGGSAGDEGRGDDSNG